MALLLALLPTHRGGQYQMRILCFPFVLQHRDVLGKAAPIHVSGYSHTASYTRRRSQGWGLSLAYLLLSSSSHTASLGPGFVSPAFKVRPAPGLGASQPTSANLRPYFNRESW